jgi:uncharacterized UPF0146 family protein
VTKVEIGLERERTMIVVIDYGMGNLGSIANMLKKVGAKFVVLDIAPEHVPDGGEHGVAHPY